MSYSRDRLAVRGEARQRSARQRRRRVARSARHRRRRALGQRGRRRAAAVRPGCSSLLSPKSVALAERPRRGVVRARRRQDGGAGPRRSLRDSDAHAPAAVRGLHPRLRRGPRHGCSSRSASPAAVGCRRTAHAGSSLSRSDLPRPPRRTPSRPCRVGTRAAHSRGDRPRSQSAAATLAADGCVAVVLVVAAVSRWSPRSVAWLRLRPRPRVDATSRHQPKQRRRDARCAGHPTHRPQAPPTASARPSGSPKSSVSRAFVCGPHRAGHVDRQEPVMRARAADSGTCRRFMASTRAAQRRATRSATPRLSAAQPTRKERPAEPAARLPCASSAYERCPIHASMPSAGGQREPPRRARMRPR